MLDLAVVQEWARKEGLEKLLEVSDRPVDYNWSTSWSLRDSIADRESGSSLCVLGTHTSSIVEGTYVRTEYPGTPSRIVGSLATDDALIIMGSPAREPSVSYTGRIEGGEAIGIWSVCSFEQTTMSRNRKITMLVIRPTANTQKVLDWLNRGCRW